MSMGFRQSQSSPALHSTLAAGSESTTRHRHPSPKMWRHDSIDIGSGPSSAVSASHLLHLIPTTSWAERVSTNPKPTVALDDPRHALPRAATGPGAEQGAEPVFLLGHWSSLSAFFFVFPVQNFVSPSRANTASSVRNAPSDATLRDGTRARGKTRETSRGRMPKFTCRCDRDNSQGPAGNYEFFALSTPLAHSSSDNDICTMVILSDKKFSLTAIIHDDLCQCLSNSRG